ncbi:amidohydrolase [Acanthopleuribacter pedis]|uniref:Amidohydrolase n=1 Tax=Acanthopleuribacter pedis TaxID=442870 RepID=A0A8J7QNW3_9BACT|nr:amidohydrolase [Acanthopleuribacter pedis]MBO1322565.1 amidohydrolase [Acanthopleuribacter pedis]
MPCPAVVCCLALLSVPMLATSSNQEDIIFRNGTVLTMNPAQPHAQAVWVKNGIILAVGEEDLVMEHETKHTRVIDLQGGTLMPGFIEPHGHLLGTVVFSLANQLSPCLPAPYQNLLDARDGKEQPDCPLYIYNALMNLAKKTRGGKGWIFGLGLDPSRMAYKKGVPASVFHDNPRKILDATFPADRPVFIMDQSGHLAYVNTKAFEAIKVCAQADPCPSDRKTPPTAPPPGVWVIDPETGQFTGLLQEQEAFGPFIKAMAGDTVLGALTNEMNDPETLKKAYEGSLSALRNIARTGVTTFVNGGVNTSAEVLFIETLMQKWAKPMFRVRSLYAWDFEKEAPKKIKPTFWDETNQGMYSVSGVKLWADGSTQGCTANLFAPYAARGACSSAGYGNENFAWQTIQTNLEPYWNAGWAVQVHANGDQAVQNTLRAMASLQAAKANNHPHVLIHFTVGDDRLVSQVAEIREGVFVSPVDVSVTHLIGHVAYWGGAFQNILDGLSPPEKDETGRVPYLDPTGLELRHGVPFSFHSDTPVSVVNPLWFVSQAVTRLTWFYPNLAANQASQMPGDQTITVQQALEAITIVPARQNGISNYVGSIEVGKVADLVHLAQNPLTTRPMDIRAIPVIATYVHGMEHIWVEDEK